MCTLSYHNFYNPSLEIHRLVLPNSTDCRCMPLLEKPGLDPTPHLSVSPPEREYFLVDYKMLIQKHRAVCPWVYRVWTLREEGPGTVSHHCCHQTFVQHTSWFSPLTASAILNLTFLKSMQLPPHALLQPSFLSTAGSQSTVGSLSLAGSQFIAGFSIHGRFSVHSWFSICSWLSISSWFSIHSWFSSTADLSSQLVCNPQLILNFLIHSWYWQPFKDIISVWLLCQQINMTWRVRMMNHTHSWWDPGDWSHGWWN